MVARQILRKIPVTAVHRDDLEPVLRRLGVYGEAVAGKIKCYFCDINVTMENIGDSLALMVK